MVNGNTGNSMYFDCHKLMVNFLYLSSSEQFLTPIDKGGWIGEWAGEVAYSKPRVWAFCDSIMKQCMSPVGVHNSIQQASGGL